MNDKDFKLLFKETSVELADDFSDTLMQKINLQHKTAKSVIFTNIKIVNIILSAIISLGLIIYYFLYQEVSSELSQFISKFTNNINIDFTKIFTLDISKTILYICLLVLFVLVFDKILFRLFNRKN